MKHVSFEKMQLVILAERHQPIKNGLSFSDVWPELDGYMTLPELSVEVPFHQGEKVWILKSLIHDTTPSLDRLLTLGRRMLKGETRWSTIVKVPGEFTFIDC